MDFLKRNFLLFIVFLTGAAILIIEVVAVRVLSPYYGNTIFTVSSVIGVILAALSFGYFIGGKLSDAHPSLKWFFSIIFLGGLSVLLLQLLNIGLMPSLGYGLSIVNGPFLSSVLLFFLPAFLLGMLSPYAIRLQKSQVPEQGIGSVSGSVFFWSTLGSILGSFSAGFIFIPKFGINQIIITVGFLLVLMGLIPLLIRYWQKKKYKKIILFVFIIIFLFSFIWFSQSQAEVLYSQDGIYEKITITDGEFNDQPARFLYQDRSYSGAMYLDSDELVFDYTKYYSLYKIFKPEIKEALIIGGGAYSVPKKLLNESTEVNVDVAEIEPVLFELSKRYFDLPDDPRLHNYVEDGRRFLHDTDKKYDLIFSDVYHSLFSVPAHFTTKEFFEIALSKLNQDGILILNLIGDLSRQQPSLIFSEIKTFKSVFPNSYFIATQSASSLDAQNLIFVGYKSDKIIDFKDQTIIEHEEEIINGLAEKNIDLKRFELSDYSVLTDNYAPVDYLTAKVLGKTFTGGKNILNGDEILAIIEQQLRFGPRYLSALGHTKVQDFLIAELESLTSDMHIQKWEHLTEEDKKYELTNIMASFFPEKKERIILGTHYDSKKYADQDLQAPLEPVPGANDSASGVAVLLELARALMISDEKPVYGIDIVFFDGEEGKEDLPVDFTGWQAIGSEYFAQQINEVYKNAKPKLGIILDMVCDKDLQILQEESSLENAAEYAQGFWQQAQTIAPNVFKSEKSGVIRDDHTALNEIGIPSFLIIDYDYPVFHTTKDTIEQCSSQSLEIVAKAVFNYLYALE